MMIRIILTILMVLPFLTADLIAQNPERCGTAAFHAENMEDPDYAADHQSRIDRMVEFAVNRVGSRMPVCATTILIPVAVHFQNTGLPIACATDMALSQVETLNADFAATNADIDNWNIDTAPLFPGIMNDESCIQFCLATLNHPAGFGLNEGDYAVTLNQTTGDNDGAWSGYLNFWVRDIGPLGYSPLGGSGNGDGVTCDINAFGSVACGGNTLNAQYNLGRTITHEVGHYFSLEHPFDDSGAAACADHDNIADTPDTDDATYGCPNAPFVNCTENVLWPTYMEYCDDLCLFMFTAGQVDQMDNYANANLQNLINNSVTTCQEAACIGFEADIAELDETCDGNDGRLTISTTAGNPPFEYSADGGLFFQLGNVFTGLGEGTYDVVVVDDEACEYTETVTLTRAQAELNIVQTQASFCGAADGMLEVNTNSGGGFQYSFNGGSFQPSGLFENIFAGNHLIEAQNNTGCTGSIFVNVDDENDLGISIEEIKAVNCFLFDNGRFAFRLNGGEEPFQFVLDDAEESTNIPVFDMLSVGEHIVRIEDGRGCKASIPFTIARNANSLDDDCPCTVYMPNAFSPNGDDVNERFVPKTACPLRAFNLQIFDRFGTVIFETDNINITWGADGGTGYYVADGIYHYKLKYAWGEDGDSSVSREEIGSITVIR